MNNLRLVEYAVALEGHRSFARAAQAMRVTQPTFSRGIAALEADLGVRLFDRSTRRVEPTPEGIVFLQRAAAVLAEVVRLRHALDDHQSLRFGQLTIGVGPYPLDISVLETVARLASRHPSLHIKILEGKWREFGPRLLTREVELAVMEASIVRLDPRFHVEMLPSHVGGYFCRAGHPLSDRRGLSLNELFQYPFVGIAIAERAMQQFDQGLPPGILTDPATGDLTPRITVTSVEAIRQIVKRTDGIGLCALTQVAEDVHKGTVVVLDVEVEPLRTGYGIGWLRERTLSPAAQLFVRMIKQVEAEVCTAPPPPAASRASPGRRRARGRR
ncbi:MAG: LysR family transcriptional regulator [Gammaproteobacteria bacterium]|nr:LysR family transcriptional regulator [Gammaproteobacteria bacterium]